MFNSVYLILNDKDECEKLKKQIESDELKVLGYSCDYLSSEGEVLQLKPDLVITDLMLKNIDGIGVVARLKEVLPQTKSVVYSSVNKEGIINCAISKGASYYFVKPVKTEELVARIKDIFSAGNTNERQDKKGLDEKISKIIISVGIPPHIRGYGYLREGVKMAVNEPEIINSITKRLYPKISEKYNTTPSKVERAIRHAIEVAWNRGRIESINSMLGVRAYVGSEKPTNGEFIALVADKMLLEGA
ncbi:MAG: sporulation transcription factor Spo0A [Christensenellaceae bacterium]